MTVIYFCVTRHGGDHFGMYRNTESLCHVIGTNIVLSINYTANKQTQKKRTNLWLPKAGSGGMGIG